MIYKAEFYPNHVTLIKDKDGYIKFLEEKMLSLQEKHIKNTKK